MLQTNFTTLAIVFGSVLLAMSLHEAMHAFTSHWLGDTTAHDQGRLTLNPLKHIDLFTTILLPIILVTFGLPPFGAAKPVPFNPHRVKFGEYGAALVGIAGPITNLSLAIVTALLMRVTHPSGSGQIFYVMYIFILVNIGFFVFNMIPFPPLDGSRLLYAFAPEGLQNLMLKIESLGFTSIVLFMFLLFPVLSPVISNVIESLFNLVLKLAG